MLEFFQYSSPTRIVGGHAGFLSEPSPELEAYAGARVGLVTDSVIADLDVFRQLRELVEKSGLELVEVFSDVPQDSELTVAASVAARFQAAGVNLLVAIGGGSVIDTAKGANILLSHGGDLRDYQGAQTLTEPLLPLVVVPTTVGTGSEVTMVAVISDKEDARKLTFVDRGLTPTLALLDPQVTYTLPPRLVGATAMDAFTHAIEAFVDNEHSPFSDAMAVAAATEIQQWILAALQAEGYEEARSRLQIASTMAGIAFNHSMVGIVHAMAHALGGVCKVPHGEANNLMLVEGLLCNASEVPERIAEFGLRCRLVVGTLTAENTAELAGQTIERIAELRERVAEATGLPLSLTQAQVRETDLDMLVERTEEDGSMVYNPKYVSSEEIRGMYQNLLER